MEIKIKKKCDRKHLRLKQTKAVKDGRRAFAMPSRLFYFIGQKRKTPINFQQSYCF